MPATFPSTFIPIVGAYLNLPTEGKTEEETAEMIASQYHLAVTTANTSLHANMPFVQAPYAPIKAAVLKTLMDIKESEGKAKLIHFKDWAIATSAYWLSTTMSPAPFHPVNMALSTATFGIPTPIVHIINNGGNIPALQAALLLAFSDEPSPVLYGIPFATKLALAFTNHLKTVRGIQTELVFPGSVLTPLPPFPSPQPWVGMV